ncbi:MAG: Asp-tRNA(Asn)/Glu-tRNA(Gln) amidotransferase subunit GatB [Actinomycetota bacterium]|nr:Asp-tRNA(Asn)/Glu-tRNA(Gln) amidotransferase subunit GatB [Actinomycetota bacterium]
MAEEIKDYEVVIGLEIHVELNTQSKMFCDSAVSFGDPPNTHVCPVCLGLPGTLPVINEKAVEYTALIGLAVDSRITEVTQFHRKNYFYPDMPKNYQISQYDRPICDGGRVVVEMDDYTRIVGITRVHLEEDTGKLIHIGKGGRIAEADYSLVDFNRAGTPLAEIVTEPDIRSPQEARAFAQKLRSILLHLGVSDCNMEEGSMRCDANVSLRRQGDAELGTKTEIKNMNSFRALVRALEYEIVRQYELLETGDRVVQETRHWDANRNITTSLRSKEEAHDYRYFADPDLVPIELSRAWVGALKAGLPELPDAREARLISTFGLPAYGARFMTQSKAHGDYFETIMDHFDDARIAANWMMGELAAHLNASNRDIADSPVTPEDLAEMLILIKDAVISGKMAKDVFKEMYETGKAAPGIVEAKGLKQISGTDEVAALVDRVLTENPKAVEEYRSGKKQALGFLVGQVMALSRGQANPGLVNEALRARLPNKAR